MEKRTEDIQKESICMEKEQVLKILRQSVGHYRQYLELREEWKQGFMEFCQGKRTLPLLYDPFFKMFFNPDVHRGRLEDFLSSLLGKSVRIQEILPSEDSLLSGETLVIMDIIVELSDGSLANVEVQKVPYAFPEERISCYSADMLLRQYSRVRGQRGKKFTYGDIKKVYTIIIYEKSTEIFYHKPEHCVHHGKVEFDTGLEMDFLQEYWLVALDVFRKFHYSETVNRLTGWLSLFVTQDWEEAKQLIKVYPWLEPVYREMAVYRQKPKEVLGMFSEALRELDRNTVQYMIDEQKKIIEENKKTIQENEKVIQENEKVIQENEKVIQESEKIIRENEKVIQESEKIIRENEKVIQENEKVIQERDRMIKERDEEIARLRLLLEKRE